MELLVYFIFYILGTIIVYALMDDTEDMFNIFLSWLVVPYLIGRLIIRYIRS